MKFCLDIIAILALVLIPQGVKADGTFIDRVLFSDKAYAQEIEVKAYIVTREQACAALCDPSEEPIQLDRKDLYGHKTFLLLLVRNMGNKHAWGTLACKVPRYHWPMKVSIVDVNNPKNFNIYLLHLGSLMLLPHEIGAPEVSIEWDALYTK